MLAPELTLANPLSAPGTQALAGAVLSLLEDARSQLDRDVEAAKSSIARAASLLKVDIDRCQPAAASGQPGGLAGWQIHRIRAFVDGNLDARIQVYHLSRVAKLGPAHFSRAFKRSFGDTVHGYLVRRRVDRAGHLMLASDAGLSEIAQMCGFSDQAHLSRAFRQSAGQSPAAWRRERRDRTA